MKILKLDDGREVSIDRLTPYEAMGLAEGCRQLSGMRQWWRIATAVAAIRSIDGIMLPLPTHEKHVEGLVSRFSRQQLREIIEVSDIEPDSIDSPELEVAELTPLETLRLWATIGTFESVSGWVAPAFIAASVRKIDNDAIPFPVTKGQIKAVVERLDLAGMTKASTILLARSAAEQEAEADKRAAIKN